MKVADELLRYRKKNGLNQGDMAQLLKVSYPTYRLWEKGYVVPNPDNMKRVRKLLTSEK